MDFYDPRRSLESEDHHEDEHDNDQQAGKPWGHVVGASILIQAVTFSGLLLVGFVSCFQRLSRDRGDKKSLWHRLHHQIVPSLASGALLATTVFLLIPEGFELLEGAHGDDFIAGHAEEDDHRRRRFLYQNTTEGEYDPDHHDEEHEEEHVPHNTAAWKFGASLLGGFLFPILLGAIFPPPDISQCEVCRERALLADSNLSPAALEKIVEDQDEDEDDDEKEYSTDEPLQRTVDLNCDNGDCSHCHEHTDDAHDDMEEANPKTASKTKNEEPAANTTATPPEHPRNVQLAASILLGDFCHNFCDGIFIGTAFLLCSKSIAWTLVATTIYHEIAQEMADFALLTHHCGLTVPQALAANFVAGCSVLLGGLIVLSVRLGDTAVGAILCISAGVYIYIAAAECLPRIQAARRNARDTLIFLLCFVLGAVPIGLVLLNHGHCYEGGGDGGGDH